MTAHEGWGVAEYREIDCLLNSLFKLTKKKYQIFVKLARRILFERGNNADGVSTDFCGSN